MVLGPGVGKRKERESGVFFHGSSKDQDYSTHCLDLTGRKEAVEVWASLCMLHGQIRVDVQVLWLGLHMALVRTGAFE